ncbi:hypothetical protein MTP99_010159 [Tenebrio molitor]|nr:hypothetical protein MTP99_010159 [Tenebrio molitor]
MHHLNLESGPVPVIWQTSTGSGPARGSDAVQPTTRPLIRVEEESFNCDVISVCFRLEKRSQLELPGKPWVTTPTDDP